MQELDHLIAQVPLFTSLPKSEHKVLAKTLQSVTIPEDEVLFQEGDIGDRFYVVLEGKIEIVKGFGSQDAQSLAFRGPGEFIGEMSLFNREGRRTATVISREPAWLLEMTRADFDQLLNRQPMLAYEMVRVLSMRLTAAHNSHIQDLHEKNLQLREAYEALKAAQAQIIEKEKLERELQLAHEIQMNLLPKSFPSLEGFDFGGKLVPARAVGGDMYDLLPLHRDRVGIVVGDVTDKGVPAAMVMAQTHALLRAEAHRSRSPAKALERVNQHLLEVGRSGLFVTMLYGVLDRTVNEFSYARAGHELPILTTSAGAVRVAEKGLGQPLGILPKPQLDVNKLTIPKGSTLLLYTDGVTDVIDEEQPSKRLDWLKSTLRSCRGESAQYTCEHFLHAVKEIQGEGPQLDDVTLVAVRRLDD
jgi:serine phosphatase RsbU (regulator of sigma subunit)